MLSLPVGTVVSSVPRGRKLGYKHVRRRRPDLVPWGAKAAAPAAWSRPAWLLTDVCLRGGSASSGSVGHTCPGPDPAAVCLSGLQSSVHWSPGRNLRVSQTPRATRGDWRSQSERPASLRCREKGFLPRPRRQGLLSPCAVPGTAPGVRPRSPRCRTWARPGPSPLSARPGLN